MSDDPTRRIPEVPPREVPPRELPPEYVDPAPVYAPDEDPRVVADRVRSLQTALALVGVLAVAALGVALWALLTRDDERRVVENRGASTERVAQLEARVDELRDAVRDVPSAQAVDQLQEQQQQLEGQVEEVAQAASADRDVTDEEARAGIEQVSADVQELETRLAQLEESAVREGFQP